MEKFRLIKMGNCNLKSLSLFVWSIATAATLCMLGCQSDPLVDEYGVWSFSGYVIDGAAQVRLSGVKIHYLDNVGINQTAETDNLGKFFIDKLPYGDRTFEFEYVRKDTTEPQYTKKMIVTGSYSESRSIDGLLGEVSKVVALYPLTAAVSGEVYYKLHGSEKVLPAERLSVKALYLDSTMQNVIPSSIASVTAINGSFSIDKIPLAPGAVITFSNFSTDGVTYTLEPVNVEALFDKQVFSLGRLYMKAQDSTNLLLSKVHSNVLSENGFGLSGIASDTVLWYQLPERFLKVTASLSVSGGGKVACNVHSSADTVFLDPVDTLAADTLFIVSITTQDSLGHLKAYNFEGSKMFRTEINPVSRIRSNVITNDGFGMTGVGITTTLWYVLPKLPVVSSVEATINEDPECSVYVSMDTLFITHKNALFYDTLVTVSITGVDKNGNKVSHKFDGEQQFRTEKKPIKKIVSNVLSVSGLGIDNVSVGTTLWYVLPVAPLPSTVAVSVLGGGNPDVRVSVKNDTIYVDPLTDFTYDAPVAVIIKGADTAGIHFEYTLQDVKQFRTEKNIYATASNTWRKQGDSQKYFTLGDTLWVKFSEPLDTDLSKIDWNKSSALFSIFGSGASANADVWIRSDTLFVRPDQRLAIIYGGTMGFKTRVLSAGGKRSDSIDIIASIPMDNSYVLWTNTKDNMGNVRQDFGTLDSIVVVSSRHIQQVRGISGVSGKTTPPDLSLDNIVVKGDTIIYKPGLLLKPDSLYGLDFDIVFSDGNLRTDALGVSWKTALQLQIVSYNNRNAGGFRPFNLTGDSLVVRFSSPIDTSASATIPFKVNMIDVRYRTLKTRVFWNPQLTTASIYIIDTLPAADYDASPAYSSDAVNTRAVKSVTFDLITKAGEQVIGFKPKNEEIEIHSEKGFCPVDANFLLNHDSRNRVERGEVPTINFTASEPVKITFNRAIDTAAMRADIEGIGKYAGIKDGTTNVASVVSFSADGKTLLITSETNLTTTGNYFVWMKNIPAAGIANSPAINKDAGIFSGKSTNYNIIDKAFNAK